MRSTTLPALTHAPARPTLPLACLQSCERPDVVEVWDVTAADPKLLVYLKVGVGLRVGGVGGWD